MLFFKSMLLGGVAVGCFGDGAAGIAVEFSGWLKSAATGDFAFARPRLAVRVGGFGSVNVELVSMRFIERRLRDGAESGTGGGCLKRERRDAFCAFGAD